jgi:uncharacterized protein YbjT (DUF2867 family)
MASVFITGASGYMGRSLASELLRRGHDVRALVRPGSERRVACGCSIVHGNALDSHTYLRALKPTDTLVQLVGTPKPNPFKGEQFRHIDRIAGLEAVRAASAVGLRHLVYVSVAHPAPMMHDYIAVRAEVESAIIDAGLNATVLRPWYVLGPGHWWPYALLPAYKCAERVPSLADGAQRLGLVTLTQMVAALVHAVEEPAHGVRVISVPEIRQVAATAQQVQRAAA